MDCLAAVLEKLAEGDKLDKAIDVLESAASKPFPMASHRSHNPNRDDIETLPGMLAAITDEAILILHNLQLFRISLTWCCIINGNKVMIDLESPILHQLALAENNQVPGLHNPQPIFQYVYSSV